MYTLPIGCTDQTSAFLSLRWCGFHSSNCRRVARSGSEANWSLQIIPAPSPSAPRRGSSPSFPCPAMNLVCFHAAQAILKSSSFQRQQLRSASPACLPRSAQESGFLVWLLSSRSDIRQAGICLPCLFASLNSSHWSDFAFTAVDLELWGSLVSVYVSMWVHNRRVREERLLMKCGYESCECTGLKSKGCHIKHSMVGAFSSEATVVCFICGFLS